jgi:hypothetical protein
MAMSQDKMSLISNKLSVRYPASFRREAFLKARQWNGRLDEILRFIDGARNPTREMHSHSIVSTLQNTLFNLADVNENEELEEMPNNQVSTPIQEAMKSPKSDASLNQSSAEGEADGGSSSPRVCIAGPPDEEITSPISQSQKSPKADGVETSVSPPSARDTMSPQQTDHKSPLKAGVKFAEDTYDPSGTSQNAAHDDRRGERASRSNSDATGLLTGGKYSANNRITKALARLVMGKDMDDDSKLRRVVPLVEIGEGRPGLKPGLRGEVLPVHEEELATIIAYSLASEEYHNQLIKFLRDECDDTDLDFSEKAVPSAMENVAAAEPLKNPEGRTSEQSMLEHDQRNESAEWGNMERTDFTSTSVTQQNNMINMIRGKSPEPESYHGRVSAGAFASMASMEAARANEFRRVSGVSDGNFFNQRGPIQPILAELRAGVDMIDSDGSTTNNFVGSAAASRVKSFDRTNSNAGYPHRNSSGATGHHASIGGRIVKSESLPVLAEAVGAMNEQTGDNEVMMKVSEAADRDSQSQSASHTPSDMEAENMTFEKQMMSQTKSHVRHTFEETDENDRVVIKFVCTSYWATQFEAVRAEYMQEEDNAGFIRSLSMSSRWATQGGKSGASFSKSVDERFVIKVKKQTEYAHTCYEFLRI